MIRHAALFLALVAPAHGDKCDWIEAPPPSPPKAISAQCSIYFATYVAQCCTHSDCGPNQYCFDEGYLSTGVWNDVGKCSTNPSDCCASGDADPIDRDPSQCPAASGCSTPGRRLGDKIPGKASAMAMLGTLTKIISMPDVVRMNDLTRAASDDDIAKHLITQPGHSGRMLQSSNRVCALENMNTGSCGGLRQKVDGCWAEHTWWTSSSSTSSAEICCAENIDDCCESNPGAFAGAIITVIVFGGLAILSSVACCHFKCCSCCPCNKHNPNATIHPGGDAHIPAC